MISVTLKVKENRINGLRNLANFAVKKSLTKIGQRVADRARDYAPRQTGALAEGIYYVTDQENDYTERASEAHRRRPDEYVVPMMNIDTEWEVIVAPCMPYGPEVEFGGVSSPARPYLRPALLEADKAWIETMVNYFEMWS